MPYRLADLVLYFFIYSFCGWAMETVLCSIQEKHFVNRGFLNGPICPIYGCGLLLILLVLTPVRDGITNPLYALPLVYVVGTVLASALEYFTSWGMEKLFHARWWDYSHYRINLHGRICLPISLLWGVLAAAFLYLVQPLLEGLVTGLYQAAEWLPALLADVFFLLFLVDLVISVNVARAVGKTLEQLDKWSELLRIHLESLKLPSREAILELLEKANVRFAGKGAGRSRERKERLAEWRALPEAALRRRLADAADELRRRKEEVMAGTRALQRRMLRAFPHLNRQGKTTAAADLREYWAERRKSQKGEDREGKTGGPPSAGEPPQDSGD